MSITSSSIVESTSLSITSSSIAESTSVSTIVVIEVGLVTLVSSFFVSTEGFTSLLSLVSTERLGLISLGFTLRLSFWCLLLFLIILIIILSIIFLEIIIKILIFLIIENLVLISFFLIILIFLRLNLGGSGSWLSSLLSGLGGLLGRLLLGRLGFLLR